MAGLDQRSPHTQRRLLQAAAVQGGGPTARLRVSACCSPQNASLVQHRGGGRGVEHRRSGGGKLQT